MNTIGILLPPTALTWNQPEFKIWLIIWVSIDDYIWENRFRMLIKSEILPTAVLVFFLYCFSYFS